MDDRTDPTSAACAGIRKLMVEGAERGLSDFEAARVERHVVGCSDCTSVIEGKDRHSVRTAKGGSGGMGFDLRGIVPPTEAEWRQVKAGIWTELGLDNAAARGNAKAPAHATPERQGQPPGRGAITRIARLLIPAAAGLALGWLLFHQPTPSDRVEAPLTGLTESREGPTVAAEILELGEGQDFVIMTGDDEDGVVILMTTSG